MRFSFRWPPAAILGGLMACAGGGNQELAGQPGLLGQVRSYYDQHAMEEGGLCGSPRLVRVTGSSLEQDSAERMVVQVSYAYNDPSVQPTAWGQFSAGPEGAKPAGVAGPSRCRGFGTRTFTAARKADGLEVIAMTGSQRKGIEINKIDTRNVW